MKKCPKYGENLIEIIYGMPGPELFEAEERGEVILGGCCVSDDDPKYRCKKCDIDYSRDLKKAFKPDHGIELDG
ncbi:hypothetical protein IJH26_01030 [Candidatus Saccharibacteria bacterium]|nr:hypothetical protein [Candidatus Saccharibacteria bacterium]